MSIPRISISLTDENYDASCASYCQECGCHFSGYRSYANLGKVACRILGITKAPFRDFYRSTDAIVYECPKCFSKWWHHFSEDYAKSYHHRWDESVRLGVYKEETE